MKIIKKLIIVSFIILVSISTFATNENIAPQVEITSPKDEFATNVFSIPVTVNFSAYKPGPGKGAQGNVTLIVLKMNDKEIGRFDNPPQIKDGTYTFQIDLSNLSDQILSFSAVAYQGNPKAEIFRTSSPVKVILDRTPPVVKAAITPLPNQKAWNNTDVTVTFSATDNLSGVAKVDIPVTVTTEGTNQIITGKAWDKAGNEGSVSVTINIDKTKPQITNLSPANEEIVKISTPTISATLSDNLSGIDVSSVRIILDGNDVTSNATITQNSITYIPTPLADGNHTVTINISDNASNTATTTSIFQISTVPPIPEGAGFIDGIVYNSKTNQALEGAKISAKDISGSTISGLDGRFTFIVPDFPESNILDVTLAIEKQGYTSVYRSVKAISSHHVSVDDIYLVPIDTKVTKITPSGGIATNSSEAVMLIFPEGAAKTDIDVVITQFEKPEELPQPLPNSSVFTYAVNLKPDNEIFSKPVQIKIANSLGFAPGTPIPIGFYNKSEDRWIGVGMGSISLDGKYAEFEITKFSNYDFNFGRVRPSVPRSPGDRNNEDPGKDNRDNRDPEEKACSSSTASKVYSHEGSLIEEHNMPSINLFGKPFNLTFHYDSFSANPNVLITNEILQEVVPSSFTWNLKIEGINKEIKFQGAGGRILSQFIWDGVNISGEKLPTGAYPYTLDLSNDYRDFRFATTDRFGGPPISSTNITVPFPVPLTKSLKGKAIINNQIKSPFGSGWTLEGLDRIHKMSDGSVLLTKGNGGSLVFNYDFGATFEPISDSDYFGSTMAFDSLSNLYVVKRIGSRGIVKISLQGVKTYIDVINPYPGSFWTHPINMTVDKQNNVYICFIGSMGAPSYKSLGFIMKITPDGTQSIIVSDLNSPSAIAVDTQGNIIVVESTLFDFYGIKKITPSGEITPFFNIGQNPILDMVIDSKDNLYFSASVPGGLVDIIKVTPTGEMSTFVSGLRALYRGHTMCIDIDTNDNIYTLVTSRGWNQVIIKIFPDGSITRIVGEVRMKLDTVGPSIVVSSNSLLLNGGPFEIPVSTLEFDQPLIKFVDAIKSKKGFISPDGDFSTLVKNDDGTFTRRLKDGTKYNFDTNGLLTSVVDRNRNIHTTLYQYIDANSDGKAEEISKIILPNQQEHNFIYDINGKLQSVTDPASKVTSFNIDANGNLIQITNPDNSTRKFVYDAKHLITSKFNERNMKTEYTYNNYGRLTKVLSSDSSALQFNPAEIQGLINNIPSSSGTETNPAPAIGPVSTTITDTRGFTTTLTTDKFGAVTENINALGRVWRIERDFNGLPLRITTPNPPNTTYYNDYDRKGNLLTSSDFSGGPTRYFYEPVEYKITNIRDGKRNVTTFVYDAKGDHVGTIDPSGNRTEFVYDSRHLLISTKDALGNITSFTYDTKGKLITTTDPLGRITTLNYDLSGNVINSIDPLGRITQFNYDIMNRLTRVIDADNRITNYEYDAVGNLTLITDAKGNRTSFEYDERDRLKSTTNPLGYRKTFVYDSNGNLIETQDAKNQRITMEYDAINQLTRKVRADDIFTHSYDTVGNLTSTTNNASVLTMNYDGLSRLTKVTTGGQTQPVTTINYTYDVLGNRLSMKDPQGGITNYTYCGPCAATLISIVNPKGQEVAFEYDRLSRRTNLLYPNMMKGTYSYDFASQLTNITHSRSSLIYQTNTYTYDNAGNRTSMTDLDGTHNYTYDVVNRLTSSTHPQMFNPAESFNYDAIGNRTSSHISATYTYDTSNRLLEDEKYIYTYDANGNMTSRQNKSTLEIERSDYDSENQLIKYTASDGSYVDYKYDGLGRRIAKLFNGLKTDICSRVFIYDIENILEERSGDGATILARYTHGPGIDEPLIMERAGLSYFYHADALGSITALTDSTGTIVKTYTYDSFGRIVNETGTIENFYTYTARERDSESNLYYYRARYYSPSIGRFLQEDPVELAGGINLYNYVGNNPVNFTDPTGYGCKLTCHLICHLGCEAACIIIVKNHWVCLGICAVAGGIGCHYLCDAICGHVEKKPKHHNKNK